MELSRIIISEINGQNIIYLRELDGERVFPILIGVFEATSINRKFTEESPPRPLTHDLLKNSIEELGGEVEDIIITNLMDHTYFAVIRVRQDEEIVEIDSRPSDAIALAVQFDPPRPIFVNEDVLEQAS